MCFLLETFDKNVGARQGSIVYDLRGTGLGNADVGLVNQLMNTYTTSYPYLFRAIYVYEATWTVKPMIEVRAKLS